MLSYKDIEVTRQHYSMPRTETMQNQLIIDYFIQHSGCDCIIHYSVSGISVCKTCWRLVCGLRYNKFSMLKKKFKNGVLEVEHGRKGIVQPSEGTLRMISWLKIFAKKVGDRMPMSQDIHLPSCLSKIDIYNLASDDLMQGSAGRGSCISMSNFYSLWEEKFSHIKIPKVLKYVHLVLSELL